MKVYSVHDKKFNQFGKLLKNPFVDYFTNQSVTIQTPSEGVEYLKSVEAFESPEALAHFSYLFGDLDIQIGYCYGVNDTLNALEWHKTNEINIALEDMILLLGDFRKMKDNLFHTKDIKAFLVKKGESVELYQTTLHFCPISVKGNPFKSIVILPRGTNMPLEKPHDDKYLISKNKWLICHKDYKKQVELGRAVGLIGKNVVIK